MQFGLNGDPKVQNEWDKRPHLQDDRNWLPLGPPGRRIRGATRFQKGYWAYAGAGKNSRDTQLILAFTDQEGLAGGCPWEVPFAQLVGNESFKTLDSINTEYHEAPSQGKIRNRGNEYVYAEFPRLDFVDRCDVMASDIPWQYKSTVPPEYVPGDPAPDSNMTREQVKALYEEIERTVTHKKQVKSPPKAKQRS